MAEQYGGGGGDVVDAIVRFLEALANDDDGLLRRYLHARTDTIEDWFESGAGAAFESGVADEARQLLVHGKFEEVRRTLSAGRDPAAARWIAIWIA